MKSLLCFLPCIPRESAGLIPRFGICFHLLTSTRLPDVSSRIADKNDTNELAMLPPELSCFNVLGSERWWMNGLLSHEVRLAIEAKGPTNSFQSSDFK